MKLKFNHQHLSILSLNEIELNDLTILTGFNGTGKTHILECLKIGALEIEGVSKAEIVYFDSSDFKVLDGALKKERSNSWTSDRDEMRNTVSVIAHEILNTQTTNKSHLFNFIVGQILNDSIKIFSEEKNWILFEEVRSTIDIKNFQKILSELYGGNYAFINIFTIHLVTDRAPLELLNRELILSLIEEFKELLKTQLKSRSASLLNFFESGEKEDFQMKVEDFEIPYPLVQNIKLEEQAYQIMYWQNVFDKFSSEVQNEECSFLSDKEFIDKNGISPICQINEILKTYDCNGYQLFNNEYKPKMGTDLSKLQVHLSLKNFQGISVDFKTLSSGEKTLMGLAFLIFKFRKKKVQPRIILLDEIDASLHPAMIKGLLDVFQRIFIDNQGLKIILATHSPTTIALAPEESIFEVKSNPNRVIKINKDHALRIITTGVPSFSINYENRRQVFVESPYDVKYYEKISQILTPYLNPEISLTFIASGELKTNKHGVKENNCDQVKNAVGVLKKGGNQFVWGIIDQDEGNKSENNVIVLAEGERYAIENLIFDPLPLAFLIARENILKADRLNFPSDKNIFDVVSFSKDEKQAIVDNLLTILGINSQGERRSVEYLDGTILDLPKEFLNHHGHEWEEKIVKIIKGLASIKREKEDALKLAVIEKVFEYFPELMPKSFLAVLLKTQKV